MHSITCIYYLAYTAFSQPDSWANGQTVHSLQLHTVRSVLFISLMKIKTDPPMGLGDISSIGIKVF